MRSLMERHAVLMEAAANLNDKLSELKHLREEVKKAELSARGSRRRDRGKTNVQIEARVE